MKEPLATGTGRRGVCGAHAANVGGDADRQPLNAPADVLRRTWRARAQNPFSPLPEVLPPLVMDRDGGGGRTEAAGSTARLRVSCTAPDRLSGTAPRRGAGSAVSTWTRLATFAHAVVEDRVAGDPEQPCSWPGRRAQSRPPRPRSAGLKAGRGGRRRGNPDGCRACPRGASWPTAQPAHVAAQAASRRWRWLTRRPPSGTTSGRRRPGCRRAR